MVLQSHRVAGPGRRRRRRGLWQGRRCIPGQLRGRSRGRRRGRCLSQRRQSGRPVGRLPQRNRQGAMAARHHGQHVLDDQRCCRPCRCVGGVARIVRLRRQSRRPLAGVRAGGQGRCDRPATVGPPGRTVCAETSANRAGCRRPGEAFADARGPEARVATGHPARVPRDHAGLVRIRTHPPDRSGRPDPGPLPRRRGCRTAGTGPAYRTAGLGAAQPDRAPPPLVTRGSPTAHPTPCHPASSPRRSTRSDCSPVRAAFRATSNPWAATTTATTSAPSRSRRPTGSEQPAPSRNSTVRLRPGMLRWD